MSPLSRTRAQDSASAARDSIVPIRFLASAARASSGNCRANLCSAAMSSVWSRPRQACSASLPIWMRASGVNVLAGNMAMKLAKAAGSLLSLMNSQCANASARAIASGSSPLPITTGSGFDGCGGRDGAIPSACSALRMRSGPVTTSVCTPRNPNGMLR